MNTNMRLISLILILIAPTWADAQKSQENLKFSDLGSGSVIIELRDNAVAGCWTNIIEAKNYAAGQVDIVGGKVVEISEEAYAVLAINVSADRLSNGICYGFADVSVYRPILNDGIVVFGVFSKYNISAAYSDNFNNFVLDVIKEAIAEWR
tara:strand:+ start:144 stop:596 length:453 start_codon:yes stop_codon:yes gene_type:complete